MQALTAFSVQCDPWRSGFDVGKRLAPGAPEVVLLFTSIHYESDFPALLEGLREGLGVGVPVVGCTGDGVFQEQALGFLGVSALGLSTGGAVRWAVEVVPEAGDGREAAEHCARKVAEELGGPPDLAFLFADGVRADGARVVEGAAQVLSCPLLGGLAADDRQFRRSFVFAHGRAWQDAVAILGARGPLRVSVHAASGFRPVGAAGLVEDAEGKEVRRIGGLSAQGFLREQLGKAPGEVDLGIVSLALNTPGGHFLLRTPAGVDAETGALRAFGAVPQGSHVRACSGGVDEVLGSVADVLDRTGSSAFRPAAAVAVSCAGRRWLLGERYEEEIQRLRAGLGRETPLVGFLSFGEIGPFREGEAYSPAHFHNETLVLGLLGD